MRSRSRGFALGLCLGALLLGSRCHERQPVAVADGPLRGSAPRQLVDFRVGAPSLTPRPLGKAPEVKVYRTRYRQATEVAFNHKTHTKDLGLSCERCHHGEGCGRCHRRQERLMPVIESKAALHQSCVTCHQEMKAGPVTCEGCHRPPSPQAPRIVSGGAVAAPGAPAPSHPGASAP